MKKQLIFAFILSTTLILVLTAKELKIYNIGNSLTWDSKPTVQDDVLARNGYTVVRGYHIKCGRGLTYIEINPDDTCIAPPEPYGNWKHALINHEWDIITIQAYTGGTGISEVAATASIIQEAISGGRNQDCVFFLYLAWPRILESSNFADLVMTSFEDKNEPVSLSIGFLDYWYSELSSLFPTLDIRVIPTGIVFAIIDEKLRELEISPYTNTYDLYRDSDHMNHVEGRHIAMSTMLSAITGIRTEDIIFPVGYFDSYNSTFVELSHEIIWYALTSESRTKIEIQPEIKMRRNPSGQLECSFLGTLFESNNLKDWGKVGDATSPYRINFTHRNAAFYRSRNE